VIKNWIIEIIQEKIKMVRPSKNDLTNNFRIKPNTFTNGPVRKTATPAGICGGRNMGVGGIHPDCELAETLCKTLILAII